MPANCGWRTFFGLGSLVGATAVLITAMSGVGWRTYPHNSLTDHFGLKTYLRQWDNGDSRSGYIKDLTDDDYSFIDQAGDIGLGFGVPALAFSIVGMTLILIHIFRSSNPKFRNFRRVGLFLNFLSGIFSLILIVLYARKFWTGYSFILYIFCAFLTYVGVTFLASHALSSRNGGGGANTFRKTTTTTTTTTSTIPTTTAPPQEMGVYNENLA